MTSLLLRLFLGKRRDDRTAVGTLAGVTGIVCNLLLCIGKLIVGTLSGAVSIVADGLNNLSDASSSVVTLLGFRMARQPADQDHPYGHARYEYLSGLVVAALIFVIGFDLAKSSVEKILRPEAVTMSALSYGVLLASIGVKLWMALFNRRLGRQIQSTTLLAASADSRNDVIASTAVLLSCILQQQWGWAIDGWAGLAVAGFILWSGLGIARETISPLLGQQDRALVEQLSRLVLDQPRVLGIHDLLVHDYGPGQCYASVHVEMDAEADPLLCHDVIDEIECQALVKLNVHLVIHYDPVVQNDAERDALYAQLQEILAEMDAGLSMHDFRLVRGARQTKLVFDLAVPYDLLPQRQQLQQRIDTALQQRGLEYTTVIHFDGVA